MNRRENVQKPSYIVSEFNRELEFPLSQIPISSSYQIVSFIKYEYAVVPIKA